MVGPQPPQAVVQLGADRGWRPVGAARLGRQEDAGPVGPETLADLIAELGPKARAATAQEAAEAAEIAVVTVPLKNLEAVPVAPPA